MPQPLRKYSTAEKFVEHCFREGIKPSPTLAVVGGHWRSLAVVVGTEKNYVEHCFRKGMKPFPALPDKDYDLIVIIFQKNDFQKRLCNKLIVNHLQMYYTCVAKGIILRPKSIPFAT